jgi:hypothetical protein
MKPIALLSFAIWITGLFSGCQSGAPSTSEAVAQYCDDYTLVKGREKNLLVDTLTRDRFPDQGYWYWQTQGGAGRMARLNDKILRILIYDWATGRVIHTVPLQGEGPEGVGQPEGLQALDDSTFLIISRRQYGLFLVDWQGKIKQKYRLLPKGKGVRKLDEPDYVYSAELWHAPERPLLRYGRKFFLGGFPDLSWHDPRFFEEGRVMIALDTSTGNYAYHTPYPDAYRQKGKFTPDQYLDASWAAVPETSKLVFSFPADAHLYVSDTALGQYTAHEARTRQAPAEVAFMDKPDQDGLDFVRKGHYYGKFYYDPYRKVYYRFVVLPARPTRIPTGEVIDGQRASIIILDQGLRVVGETVLPFPLGLRNGVVIDAEGLWLEGVDLEHITKNRIAFEPSEDQSTFTLFKLSETKK